MPATQMMNAAGRPSLQLGRGVDSATGSPLGIAVVPDEAGMDHENSGQQVRYDVSIIETSEEMSSALGISAGAEMRYGLFSASGSVDLQEQAEYKNFASYVLAKCDVVNPPIGLLNPTAKPEAHNLKDNPDSFRRAYGDHFVRAAVTGGQFYVLLEIIHKDSQVQKSLAASVQAQYNGFLAGGQVNFQLSEEEQQQLKQSSFRILQYQASGQGVETSMVNDVSDVVQRLKSFPQTALAHPVAIQVELATYDTISGLQPNLQRRAALEAALEDAAQKKLAYKNIINDCSFFLDGSNRDYFQDPPTADVVQGWKVAYTKLWNAVSTHAIALAEGTTTDAFIEPADLPIPNFKRLPSTAGSPTNVPSVVALDLAKAQDALRQAGFNPVATMQTISDQDTTTPLNVVLTQNPPANTAARKGDNVYLTYAVKQSHLHLNLRFEKAKLEKQLRLILAAHH